MLVLGLDPSLTNYGWAYVDTAHPVGDPLRVVDRGRFRTPSKMEFIDRYVAQRESLRGLIRSRPPEKVGIEFPVFDNLWSEGMYGLFLYSCEALRTEKCDVVFWTPLQVKAHARERIVRPKGWAMDKADMVEVARKDTGAPRGTQWNHNEADAFLVGTLSARFWEFYESRISTADLSEVEKTYFMKEHTFSRGKNAGKTLRSGMVFRENERFFAWGAPG